MKKIITLLCIMGLTYYSSFGQQGIAVRAKVSQTGNQIYLRWAPESPSIWQELSKANKGYEIKKYKIAVDRNLLTTPQLVSGFTRTVNVPAFTLDNNSLRLAWFQKFMNSTVWNQPRSYFENSANNDSTLIINDDYALLWAAYYNPQEINPTLPTEGIVDISSDLDKRFNTALAISDRNFQAAVFVGLGLIDTDVIEGEKYLYEVNPVGSTIGAQKGSVYIGLDDKENLDIIPPYEVSVAFVDSVAKINWNVSLLDKLYASYDIYKSINGTTFTKLNQLPLVKFGNDDDKTITYVDSLFELNQNRRYLDLNKTFYYKVVGKTPFGEEGKHSEVVSGKVKLFLHEAPQIFDASLDIANKDNKAVLRFTFPAEYNPAVQRFVISYSTSSSTTGYQYLPQLIAPVDSGRYVHKVSSVAITQSTFFRVSAIPFNGDQMDSSPELVEPIDSVPPLAPRILSVIEKSRLDTNGDKLLIAEIKWEVDTTKVENKDIEQYQVFRANHQNEEASLVNNKYEIFHARNTIIYTYNDTISFYTKAKDFEGNNSSEDGEAGTFSLNTKVYYRIRAIDKRENQGPLSISKFLRKPDNTPLPPVIITDYNMGDDGIGISWSPYVGTDSFYVDFDFEKLSVFRATLDPDNIDSVVHDPASVNWILLGDIYDPEDNSFFDIDVNKSSIYAYCVISSDESQNKSFSKPFIIEYKPNSNISTTEANIANFTAVKNTNKNVFLSWTHPSQIVAEYVLLRSTSALEPLRLYKTLENDEREFYDLDVVEGTTYYYGVMANYTDGTHSVLLKTQKAF